MKNTKNLMLIRRGLKSVRGMQTGVTSIEYALLASLIALAIVSGVTAAGVENAFGWSRDGWLGFVLDALGV